MSGDGAKGGPCGGGGRGRRVSKIGSPTCALAQALNEYARTVGVKRREVSLCTEHCDALTKHQCSEQRRGLAKASMLPSESVAVQEGGRPRSCAAHRCCPYVGG